MCYYTTLIKNPKFKANKKNRGNIPPVIDQRTEYVPIGCGKCQECRKHEQRKWMIRLAEHIKAHTNGKFITLTFSSESIHKLLYEQYETTKRTKLKKKRNGKTFKVEKILQYHTIKKTNKETGEIQTIRLSDLQGYERDNQIATRAMRLFNERWRARFGKAIHHWMVTELGHQGTENIHLHGIIWTDQPYHGKNSIAELWNYGFIWPKPWTNQRTYVNGRTVSYITKYVSKIDKRHKEYKPVILTSPGIGGTYIREKVKAHHSFRQEYTEETYRTQTGHKMQLPIYYRNKLWTEEQRELLWIQKLDKQIRWVGGEKIDISKGTKEYEECLQWYRQKNHDLGYGGRENKNRKEHEENSRQLMYLTRMKKLEDKRQLLNQQKKP